MASPKKRTQKQVKVGLPPGAPARKMSLSEATGGAQRLMQQGDLPGAERVLREICKQAPRAEGPRVLLVQTLLSQNLPLRASKVLAPLLARTEEAETLLTASRLAKRFLRQDECRAYLEKAMRLDRRRPDLPFELVSCLMELGLREEAAELNDQLIGKHPELGVPYWQRTQLEPLEHDDEHLAQVLGLLEGGTFLKRERVFLHFTCARIHQRRGEALEEFRHLDEASAIILPQRPFSASEPERNHEQILALLKEGQEDGIHDGIHDGPDLAPVLITSMPRCGSTLVERVLGTHPDVSTCGEWGFFMAWASEHLRGRPAGGMRDLWSGTEPLPELLRSFADFVATATEALGVDTPTFTEKSMSNFEFLPFLLLAFPRARVLHVQRDPLDAALSAYQVHFGFGNGFTYDLRAFAARLKQQERIMGTWKQLFPGRILDVRYEDLATRPEETARPLLEFCGLPWDPSCLCFHESTEAVHTASFLQVRRPMYTDSVGKHQRYGRLLAPAAEELGIELPS